MVHEVSDLRMHKYKTVNVYEPEQREGRLGSTGGVSTSAHVHPMVDDMSVGAKGSGRKTLGDVKR